jgi:hypothetical protein
VVYLWEAVPKVAEVEKARGWSDKQWYDVTLPGLVVAVCNMTTLTLCFGANRYFSIFLMFALSTTVLPVVLGIEPKASHM